MNIYEVIGIYKCPYRDGCSHKKASESKTCLTRRHLKCSIHGRKMLGLDLIREVNENSRLTEICQN